MYLWAVCGSWKMSLKIFVIYTGWISAKRASRTSLIVLCCGVEGGGVPGRARLNTLENRRRQPERGF